MPGSADGEADRTGAVLLVHNSAFPAPPDVIESVRAIRRGSRFPVLPVNTAFGAPPGLEQVRFAAVLLHYTAFYADFEPLGDPFLRMLNSHRDAHVTAMFQDEQVNLERRLEFCRSYDVDCVFTCLQPPWAERVYGEAGVSRLESVIPGYVSRRLVAAGRKFAKPDTQREIDVGYRGRRPPGDWGGAAQEKYEIAGEFVRRAVGRGLALDIETAEDARIYGTDWLRFVGSCRAMLGTESGAELHMPGDTTGSEIPYRTVSPRHFEAAALRTAQILFEGEYSGVLEPDVHYIPLRKDFANFDDVVVRLSNPGERARLTDAAHRDLIASGRYGYRSLIQRYETVLEAAGLEPPADPAQTKRAAKTLYPPPIPRKARRLWKELRLRIDARA